MTALGLFHRTISEVEDAILQARARQAYRTAGEPGEEQAADLTRWPVVGKKS
ncbi:hypothetical protein [Micromonospora carbonacea]|uniref:hypothetical protein n=1 Tax=Micromonospora carbonacea TaxID=47853 RepID=UPI003D741F91